MKYIVVPKSSYNLSKYLLCIFASFRLSLMRRFVIMSNTKVSKPVGKPAVSNPKDMVEATPIADLRGTGLKHFAKKLKKFLPILVILFLLPFIGTSSSMHLAAITLLGNADLRSGRIGAWVYMANGRIRAYVKPKLVLNVNTAAARAIFGFFTKAYGGLTNAQQLAWIAFKMSASNRFGQPIVVSGKEAFIRCNANLTNVGGTEIDTPPVGTTAPAPTLRPMINAATISTLTIEYLIQADGSTTEVWATGQKSTGTNRPGQSQFRLIGVIDTSVTPGAGVSIYAAYIARFGAPIVGSQTFVQLKNIDAASGLESSVTQSPAFTTT